LRSHSSERLYNRLRFGFAKQTNNRCKQQGPRSLFVMGCLISKEQLGKRGIDKAASGVQGAFISIRLKRTHCHLKPSEQLEAPGVPLWTMDAPTAGRLNESVARSRELRRNFGRPSSQSAPSLVSPVSFGARRSKATFVVRQDVSPSFSPHVFENASAGGITKKMNLAGIKLPSQSSVLGTATNQALSKPSTLMLPTSSSYQKKSGSSAIAAKREQRR
jgi:hypothetical protein